ncbi:GNAT family N-acetyltransferase [Lysinibacillus yapensis]|uniref:GNAT family N-acetyltransferase n=1 Tax=Ureibacillus yapensis TaxID=2304605 RepID=A0A396SCS7_9BACL|nr:GNAT family N-acetyltransferase [Lysinibacillus yapensis]
METLITISTLQQQDKEATREVLITSYEQYKERFTNIEDYSNYIENIRLSLDSPKIDKVLVAKDENNQILGTLQIYSNSEDAYGRPELNIQNPIVRLLGVHPSARGKGIARGLLLESINYTIQKDAHTLHLHTGDFMEDAIRLYERFGFYRDFSKDFYNNDVHVKCYRFDIHQ